MAKPNKKGPSKTVDIYCKRCNFLLFKYRKAGKGALVIPVTYQSAGFQWELKWL